MFPTAALIKLNRHVCVFKRSNQIKKIDGLHSLKFLRFLNLSSNQIRSLNGLPEKHEFLERIDLENNKVGYLNSKKLDIRIGFEIDYELGRDRAFGVAEFTQRVELA